MDLDAFPKTRGRLLDTFAESHKREVDRTENVWRTLPGVLAALGLLGAVIKLGLQAAPALSETTLWANVAHLLLALGGACLFAATVTVAGTLLPRDYRAPPLERETLAYAQATAGYFQDGADPDARTLADLETVLVKQMAETVSLNRLVNERRYRQRARAAAFIFAGFLFAALPAIFGAVKGATAPATGGPVVTDSDHG